MSSPSSVLSALQQAGVSSTDFQQTDLSVRELSGASLARIHTLQVDDLAGRLSAAGIELPRKVGQTTGRDPMLLCLRPAEFLAYSTALPASNLLKHLSVNNADHTAILDVSDGLAVFRISGEASPWLLAKLSGLDFIGGSGQGQHCARTRLGQVAIVVNHHPHVEGSNAFVYDLIFDRSIARYVWELLQHSAEHAGELSRSARVASAGS